MLEGNLRDHFNSVLENYADKLMELLRVYDLILEGKSHRDPVRIVEELITIDTKMQHCLEQGICD
jgi:hypothetical protein